MRDIDSFTETQGDDGCGETGRPLHNGERPVLQVAFPWHLYSHLSKTGIIATPSGSREAGPHVSTAAGNGFGSVN